MRKFIIIFFSLILANCSLNKDSQYWTENSIESNTNNCYISVCETKYKNKIIILSALDNLIKGGAGQAIQNLNNKFNFSEKTGLK